MAERKNNNNGKIERVNRIESKNNESKNKIKIEKKMRESIPVPKFLRRKMKGFLNDKSLGALEQTSSSFRKSAPSVYLQKSNNNTTKKRKWNRAGKKKLAAMEQSAHRLRDGSYVPPLMRKLYKKGYLVRRPDRQNASGAHAAVVQVSGAPRRLPKKDNSQVLSSVSAAEKNYYENDESLSYRPGLRSSAAWGHGHPYKHLFGPQRWDMNNKSLHKDRIKNPLGTIKKLNIGANHSSLYKNIGRAGGETKTNKKKNNTKKNNKKTKNNIMKNNKKTKNNKYGCPKGKCTLLGGRRKKTRKHIKRRKTRNNRKR